MRVQADDLPSRVLSAVNDLINYAHLSIREIVVEDGGATIHLPLLRYPILPRRWFGLTKRSKSTVRSRLTIRGVTSHTFDDTGCFDTVMILFGLVVRGTEVSLCSGEEDHGTPCFQATFEVSEFDVEVGDG